MSLKRAAPLFLSLLLATGCAPRAALRPEKSPLLTPSGIEVNLQVQGEALAIDVTNRTPAPITVVPAAIRLRREQFSHPVENPPLWREVPAGFRQPMRLRFALDGDSLRDTDEADVLLDSAVSQNGQRLGIPPLKLTRQPETKSEGGHVSLLGGFGFNDLYATPLYSGFAELRFGGESDAVEYTARIRLHAGRSEAGLSFMKFVPGFGVLFRVHRRVRLGFEFSATPPMSWIVVRRVTSGSPPIASIVFETAPELRIDLVSARRHALFLSARAGVMIGLADDPQYISPNVLLGIGYGYTNLPQ